MRSHDLTQVGTRFEVVKIDYNGLIRPGDRGTVVEGLHYNEIGNFGISVLMDALQPPKHGSKHQGWMVELKKLHYLRPLDDEAPAAETRKAHAQA